MSINAVLANQQSWHIEQGDVLDVLRQIPDGVVQCVVTSPPYLGLRSYLKDADPLKEYEIGTEPTPELYVARLVEVFREVRRVLREDGVCWLNLGDSYAANRPSGQPVPTNTRNKNGHYGKTTVPDGLKPKDLCGIPWRVAFALQADGWWLRSDIIWCLSGGTRVYAKTQKGVLPMMIKDMVRLDPATVQLWNGEKWTQVLGWSETPRPDNSIEVELRSGERIGCTPNHEWPTQRGNVRADELRVGDVIQTCQLPDEPQGAFDQPYIAAWARFVGLYLAEGSRTGNRIQISGHTKETDTRLKLCREVADSLDGTVYAYEDGNKTTIFVTGKMVNALVDQYISGHDAHDKHLSPKVWKRPNSFLREILTGYLMGDGHYDVTNDRWRLGFCRNYNWEQDLRTLCARLGIQLRLKLSTSVSQSGVFPAFRGELRFNRGNHHNAKHDGEVVRIGRSKARKFWDIGVEDEPHIFSLASGVLTHNSKPNCLPESVTDRPTKAHEYIFLLTKRARYFYDAEAVREEAVTGSANAGPRNYRTYAENGRVYAGQSEQDASTGRNKRTVWTIPEPMYRLRDDLTPEQRSYVLRRILGEGCQTSIGTDSSNT